MNFFDGAKALDAGIAVRENFIGGSFRSSGRLFENINPVDGSTNSLVAEEDEVMVDQAVAAARAALAGEWGQISVTQRVSLLRGIADRIDERSADFLEAEIADTGKPASQAATLDIPRGAANFRVFADMISTHGDASFRTDTADGAGALNYVVRKPLGVIAVISPWNLPFLLLTWKVAPALACGNAVIAKPSEETPSTATLLAEVMREVGVPDGAFNVVHGFGPGSAGEFLAGHSDINGITFTGESGTGATIMRAAAKGVKPVSFELGGKNAAIVFADADFESAVAGVAQSAFFHSGQICLCTERVYVERPIFDRFVSALKDRAKALVLGFPGEERTTNGPLISAKHREKVLSYYQLARDEGATVVAGGGVPRFGDARDAGCFVEPTIITGLQRPRGA